MKLVPNWREAWRWFSTWAFAALIALPFVWSSLPPEQQAMVPEAWRPWVVLAIALGGLLGRIVDQGKAPAP